jgi:tight adherence protein B
LKKRGVIRLVSAVIGILVVIGPLPAGAQTEDLPLRLENADTRDHPAVSLVVSMPSELVGSEIPPDGFVVTENGTEVDAIATPVPSDDLAVVLLLDVSGSMAGNPLTAAQSAALAFIEAMPNGVEVAVVTFADAATAASPFTTDLGESAAAVGDLSAAGETALYDGLLVAAEQFDPASDARRTVVLLSDGGDTVSTSTLEQALVGLLDQNVAFYGVELQTAESDPQALSRLAAATGGTVVSATDPAALELIFAEIATQLTNQYLLSYTSVAYGPTEVVVSVEVDGTTASTSETLRLPAAPTPDETTTEPEPLPPTNVEPVVPTVRPGSLVQLSLTEQPAAIYLGFIMILAALVGVFYSVRGVRRSGKSVFGKEERAAPSGQQSNAALAGLANRAIEFADRSLQGERGGRLNSSLEQAGISMRPAEFTVLSAIAGVVGFAIGYVLLGILSGVVGAVLALVLVRAYVSNLATRRKAAFAEQLPDTLNIMAGSLRAGFGMVQAIEVIASESPSPTAEEFQRVKVETHLGRDLDEALHAMAVRVGSDDFAWVTEGIKIHREVGGDIAEIIDSVNATIRDRNQIRRRIHSLSAEGRISAVILVLLPIVLATAISFINPGYVGELTGSSTGRMLLSFAAVAMVFGVFWIRRIIRLEF